MLTAQAPAPRMDGLAVPSHGLKLLTGTANRPLAEEIARNLGVDLCRVNLGRFADGEISVRIDENVRGNDVFIFQPTNPPAENVMELLLLIDAARRASAARITCVMPYYGYARQDRKDQPRVPIGAKLMANMIQAAGVDRVLGVDFHQHQLQGSSTFPSIISTRCRCSRRTIARCSSSIRLSSRRTWARRRWRAVSRSD